MTDEPRPLRPGDGARAVSAAMNSDGGPDQPTPAPATKQQTLAARVFAWTVCLLLSVLIVVVLAGLIWRAAVWVWFG